MAKYFGMIWVYGQSLTHFGIKGQKWGVRRFQYENGSYTPEGKERYGRSSETGGPQKGLTGGLFFRPRFELDKANIAADFDKAIDQNRDVFNRIQKNNDKLVDQANALSNSYERYFKHAKFSNESKQRIWDGLRDDLGNDGTDDEELYDLTLHDRVEEEMLRSSPKELKAEREAFDRALSQYWKDVETISKPVRTKYKEKYAKDLKNKKDSLDEVDIEINKLLGDTLNTKFIAYLNKHFDDYWIRDTEAFYKACMRLEDEFPYKEYAKRTNHK